MPMYWNGALPENMYAGQDEIEDIYIGSKHVWGWHTLTLVCEGLEDQVIRFRFGAGVENIPAPKLNENVIQSMKDAIKNSAGYPKDSNIDITFKGWVNSPNVEDNDNYITSIGPKVDEDIILYAKLETVTTIYMTTYEYTKAIQVKEWVDDASGSLGGSTSVGGNTVGPAYAGEDPSNYSPQYFDMNSPYVGECTWYANGRSNFLTGSAAPRGNRHWGSAGNWINEAGGGWRSLEPFQWSQANVGDVIVFSNHVAVIESVLGGGSFRVSHFNNSSSNHKGLAPTTVNVATGSCPGINQTILGFVAR